MMMMKLKMKAQVAAEDIVDANSREYEGNRTRQWSNLPRDVLNLIIQKLYFTDRISFRAVCKDWNIPIGVRPFDELPWVLTHSLKTTEVRLSDPINKKTYKIPNFAGAGGEYLNLFSGSRICGLKCGWLVFENYKRDNGVAILLYSPFSNNVIVLPSISCSITTYNHEATFSSTDPMSLDCLFVFRHYCEQRRLGISMYRNGDKEWRTKILDGDFNRPVPGFVCTDKGVCYLLLPCGKLGAFCVETQTWSWLVEPRWFPQDYMNLIEFNGDLFLAKVVFFDWEFFRYDGNQRGWIEQKSLGDKVLFLNFCGSSYLRPAFGDTTDLADKIFYICDDGLYVKIGGLLIEG